jgi:hypothetical protein
MNNKLLVLKSEILQDLEKLDRLFERFESSYDRYSRRHPGGNYNIKFARFYFFDHWTQRKNKKICVICVICGFNFSYVTARGRGIMSD